MKANTQLYTRITIDPVSQHSSAVTLKSSNDLDVVPIIRWPDGKLCLEGTLFLYKGYYDGLSTRDRGGSLITRAAYLSPLLRFCFQNRLDLHAVRDARFTMFMRSLLTEKKPYPRDEQNKRTPETIAKMGAFYFSFFKFVGNLHGDAEFVEKKLKARRKTGRIKTSRGTHIYQYWHHRALPKKSEAKRRRALSDAVTEKIFSAVGSSSNDTYIQQRRHVMLLLLKITGARRLEICRLKTDAIFKAVESKDRVPSLSLPKVKTTRPSERIVPVSRGDLQTIAKFIEIYRDDIVRRTCGLPHDSHILLLNSRTGRPLHPNTITTEFNALVRVAGIEGQACPHMLRHRYLVRLLIELIMQTETYDKDMFQHLLATSDWLLEKLRERSGHESLSGVEWYIIDAFDQIRKRGLATSNAHGKELMTRIPSTQERVEAEIAEKNLSAEEALQLYRGTLDQLTQDIRSFMETDEYDQPRTWTN